MSIDVKAQARIYRPADEIAAFAFDPKNDPLWIGGISEATLLTQGTVSKGTQVRRLAKFLGRTIDYILEVIEFVPNRLMVMQSVKSPFPMLVTYRFDPISEDQTQASIRVEGSVKGFYSITDIITAPMVRNNIRRDIKRLKKLVESSGT